MEPRVKAVLNELDRQAVGQTWEPLLVSTLRDPEKQLEHYLKGRELDRDCQSGQLVYRQVGRVVTHALPWQTPHCFRLAADVALVDRKTNAWLDDDDPLWNAIGVAAKSQGLVWGGDFKRLRDCPHMEWSDWKNFIGMAAINRMRELFMAREMVRR
jgi:peptidoglycan L-alanyl-D-glutamate endopeptidase CwlK